MMLDSNNVVFIKDFIDEGIEFTQQRLELLGIDDALLLDPDDVMENQVAVLRANFLLAERSALPFNPNDANYWHIIRARLQPIVLAYSIHNKLLQTFESNAELNNVEALMQIYRERLDNSERFRQFFSDLNEKISQEVDGIRTDLLNPQDAGSQYDGSSGAADVQANVIAQLQKTIKELEKREKDYQKQLDKKDDGSNADEAMAKVEFDGLSGVADVQANVIAQLQKTIKEYDKREKDYIKSLDKKGDDSAGSENMAAEIESLHARLEQVLEENVQLNTIVETLDNIQGDTEVQPAAADIDTALTDVDVSLSKLDSDDVESLQLTIIGLERELESTSDAAYNSFMASSDLGVVVLFMLTGFRCTTIEQVGKEAVKSVATYGIEPTIRINVGQGYKYFSQGEVSDEAKERFSQMESNDVAESDKSRHFVFDDGCALMVEGLPTDDLEKCERLYDNLGTLMRGATASLNIITLSGSAGRQKKQMEQLIVRSNDVLVKLALNLDKNRRASSRSMKKFGAELHVSLGVAPGEPSKKLDGIMKKAADATAVLMKIDNLVDPAFVQTMSRVAAAFKK